MLACFLRVGPPQEQQEMGLRLASQSFLARNDAADFDDFLQPVVFYESREPGFGRPIEANANVRLLKNPFSDQIVQHLKEKRRVTLAFIQVPGMGNREMLRETS